MKANHNTKNKVIVFIDGFNLYFGLKQEGDRFLWLNIELLAESLLLENQELIEIRYFTSRVKGNPEKEKRQKIYIEALETLTKVKIIYGHFKSHLKECKSCGKVRMESSEKMTDVNIAVSMMEGAFLNHYDTSLLITGDSDLVPPIKMIHKNFPEKKIVVAFPPNRQSMDLKNCVKGHFIIGNSKLKNSQFSNEVIKKDGFILKRPNSWK